MTDTVNPNIQIRPVKNSKNLKIKRANFIRRELRPDGKVKAMIKILKIVKEAEPGAEYELND